MDENTPMPPYPSFLKVDLPSLENIWNTLHECSSQQPSHIHVPQMNCHKGKGRKYMHRQEPWYVTQDAIRPAGPPDQCFYCHMPMGELHHPSCTIPQRTVVVAFTFELVRKVPANWDREMIEFHMNDSSWCTSNLLPELERLSDDEHCVCFAVRGQYVREADADDEENYQISVNDDPVSEGTDEC